MTNSMKDLLLGLGFKPAAKVETKAAARGDARADGRTATSTANAPRGGDPRAHRHADSAPKSRAPQHTRSDGRREPRRARATPEGMDLAKAYALRAQTEKDERIAAEKQKQEAARIKREAKAKVVALLEGKALNADSADSVRHFEYNGKIRRVHVTGEQLKALNAGQLGVVQLDGRYLLVDITVARQVQELLPSLLALRVDPDAPVAEDPYSDSKYAIPDDLTW